VNHICANPERNTPDIATLVQKVPKCDFILRGLPISQHGRHLFSLSIIDSVAATVVNPAGGVPPASHQGEGRAGGGCSVSAYWVPHVVQMKFGMIYRLFQNQ
jgi:hypothetical protein